MLPFLSGPSFFDSCLKASSLLMLGHLQGHGGWLWTSSDYPLVRKPGLIVHCRALADPKSRITLPFFSLNGKRIPLLPRLYSLRPPLKESFAQTPSGSASSETREGASQSTEGNASLVALSFVYPNGCQSIRGHGEEPHTSRLMEARGGKAFWPCC